MPAADSWERIKAHVRQYRDDPDQAHEWNPYGKVVPALLLTATGRTTGKRRTLPLIYGRTGASYVLIGSKGGTPDHPSWYRNLLANPDCEVQVKRDTIPVRARTAEGEEREALWKMMVGVLPQYEEYQSRTTRQLPVVVLDPR